MEFSELALQKILQLFPELTNFIVTFKDVTEDANRAENSAVKVGIFILQFGNGYYYLPVVAKGEVVQPLDSIFSVEDQAFYPLTKNYVQKAVNSVQLELGKSTRIPNTVVKNPSVYDMVTPPRTGKFVYASSSRLVEFLSVLPNMVKKSMLEKFSSDKDIYSALHRLFGLENIFAALKPTEHIVVQPKPAVELITEGKGLDNPTIKEILEKGYALRGEHTTNRVAVLSNNYKDSGSLQTVSNSDSGRDIKIITKVGLGKEAFIPARAKSNPHFPVLLTAHTKKEAEPCFVMFENGDYALASGMVSVGEGTSGMKILSDYFSNIPPSTPISVCSGDCFVMFSPELEMVGVYRAEHVSSNSAGTTIKALNLLTPGHYAKVGINAYHNCTVINRISSNELFVPSNIIIAKLKFDISDSLEYNINTAAAKLELTTLKALGTAVSMGYDGVEFSYNGKPVGSEVNMVKILVIKEGIAPEKAESFIKQAKLQKQVRIYLSKQADFEPGEIPQFGNVPLPQEDPLDLQKGGITQFNNNVNSAIQTDDPQSVESTIISELLQVTNMKEYIREYLPEIKETINKLGRTLFLTRINIEELSEAHNAEEINTFIANLRNVYRLLGDNYIRLEQIMEDSEEFGQQNSKK